MNQKWPPKFKNPPIWGKFGFQVDYDVANWYPSLGSHILILKIISYLVLCVFRGMCTIIFSYWYFYLYIFCSSIVYIII
jgi:hypothetical protein